MIIAPSLTDLFHANRTMIMRYFRAHGAGDHADDLLQDLWLKIERAPPVAEVSRAYLMKMAHNLVVDESRSATRRRARDHTWQGERMGLLDVDPAPDAEEVVIFRDGLRRMEDALRRLGPVTERILRRHRIDGVRQQQLAIDEGLSLSSVEKHLQKAYRAIALIQIEFDGAGEHVR
ncbi:sigma-70 family RNA polymerase sigma factor [Sphingomonas sp. UV9]|uniref:sigma-70 family RNA polymerase sigma factor n=1 Tax=Sphingomonas sp. UV9 TaxID=1851410 RepID=UPI0013E8CE2C|nr:sigma-70 family RNA polymerase sigma factor [Sphingomonas sp. UV9]